jgi:hypothetical protein
MGRKLSNKELLVPQIQPHTINVESGEQGSINGISWWTTFNINIRRGLLKTIYLTVSMCHRS